MRIAAPALGFAVCLAVACASTEKDERPAAPTTTNTSANDGSTPSGAQDSASGDSGEGYLDQEVRSLTLAEQKKAFLVDQHIENARGFKEELRLQQAQIELARALELAPENLAAKRLLAEVGALLGQDAGSLSTVIEDLEKRYTLQKQQAEADAREKVNRARAYISRDQFDEAVIELTLALDQIRLTPYAGDWEDLEGEVSGLLTEVRELREQQAAVQREEAQRDAREELRQREEEQKSQRKNVILSLLDSAIEKFRLQQYDASIELADRVLRLDPHNERATDLRDTAFRKGRELVREEYLSKKLEQYTRWQEEMDELRIPYQGVYTLPDEDYWNEITNLRARRPGFDLRRDISPGEVALREDLRTNRIPGLTINQEENLTTVINSLRSITGLPIVVDPLADEAALDEGVVFNLGLTNPITVERALNLITEMAGPQVTWTIRHDAVLVTTVEKARGELVIVNHDVQDLIFGLTDFLGPRIDRLRLLDDLEDEDGGSPFGAIGERPTINEPDDLATLIQENVAVGSWEGEGVAITPEGGNIVVVQTPEVQQQIRSFLEELRRFSASMVTIESKFLVVRDGFLQEIGVDFRGLENPGLPFTDLEDLNLSNDPTLGLDNSGDGVTQTPPSAGAFLDEGGDGDLKGRSELFFADALGKTLTNIGGLTAQWTFLNDLQVSMILTLVEKSENVELINDQMLSVHNTQRAYVTVVNQRAYVQDFDVEVAQFQAIADPQINVLTEGIVLDVRPTILNNRRYLLLEVQPTVANVVALTDFSTTLAGQTAAVTFQLPELEVQSVFTTAVVPDGGSILLGGLSRVRNIERRAEVPWLANIPLVGFFFKEEGYSDEKESLMIMIKAWITDVKEELARLEAR